MSEPLVIPQVTEAQIVAAQLRSQAAGLIKLAETLEATAPKMVRTKRKRRSLVDVTKEFNLRSSFPTPPSTITPPRGNRA